MYFKWKKTRQNRKEEKPKLNKQQLYFYAKCFGLKQNKKKQKTKTIEVNKNYENLTIFKLMLRISCRHDRSIINSLDACKATADKIVRNNL